MDAFHRDRSPGWAKIDVPLLSAGNWGGQGLHLRGNVEGFVRSALALKLFVASATKDADIFAVVRVFDPEGVEVTFQGAIDPHNPIAQRWLRASLRSLDLDVSLPYRPYHTHDRGEPLTPSEVYELDVEIWPTSIVVPAGYRLGLTVRGNDYEYEGDLGDASLTTFKNRLTGCGPFLHDDPQDRPEEIFGSRVSIHTGPGALSRLLVPVIPGS
ncbi:MAG TPA: CocE/NonD family hydrolase C-terminal non-catalytic domain-containing protein [Acidimicrobiia bacterium]|nr:CocE/NonD family hydrolase C-terminal non-catalytic domain-containing protein [Acidimicrobiia bacterium]